MRRNMRHPSPSFHLPFFPFSPLFFPFNAWLCWLAGAGAFRGQIQYVCLLNAVHIRAERARPRYRSKGSEWGPNYASIQFNIHAKDVCPRGLYDCTM